MKTTIAWMAALLTCASVGLTAAQESSGVDVIEHTLDNGMRLLMVERHDSPTIATGWVAHVGSANEQIGQTGIAHLFEHMLFKGTTTIATSDPVAELVIMAELDEVRSEVEIEYARLREAKLTGEFSGNIYDPDNATPRIAELREQMKVLQEKQRELIVKDEYTEIYTSEGASRMNAGTTEDQTIYFIQVPANKLELWFWMESERLSDPVFREFYSERDVVREERRLRTESTPVGRFEEQFNAMFWTSHPYHRPVVGWSSDVESISRAQAEAFFDTYYAPNNITAVLVGDFDPQRAIALAETYFGRLERGAIDPPQVITEEVEQITERRMAADADTNPSAQIKWHVPSMLHVDSPPMDLLTAVLEDRSGRLYRSLVEDKKIATGEPYASHRAQRYGGGIEIGAYLADGVSHQEIEDALLMEIAKLRDEPVSERELERVKNQVLADSLRALESDFYVLIQLLFFDSTGDWKIINERSAKLLAVTAEDIQRVANTYLNEDTMNILWYSRSADAAEEDPDLAGLEGQAKQAAKQMIAQISQIGDAAELQAVIAQIQSQAGQVPPEFQPVFEVVLKKANERLEALSAD